MPLMRCYRRSLLVVFGALLGSHFAAAAPQSQDLPVPSSDIPKSFKLPQSGFDHTRREVMIPMRDGVKLFTVIVVPKGAKNAPILLTRTPYNASNRTRRNNSTHMLSVLPLADEVFVA